MSMNNSETPRLRFLGGTLVLEGVGRSVVPPASFHWIEAKWRCPAVYYRQVRPWLKEHGIRNTVPRWRELTLTLHDEREPHSYQAEALQAWLEADCWGSVVLPTGAGKTFLALRAIAARNVSTLVIVPTLDLLHQWYACLENAFNIPIGVWYGQEKRYGQEKLCDSLICSDKQHKHKGRAIALPLSSLGSIGTSLARNYPLRYGPPFP